MLAVRLVPDLLLVKLLCQSRLHLNVSTPKNSFLLHPKSGNMIHKACSVICFSASSAQVTRVEANEWWASYKQTPCNKHRVDVAISLARSHTTPRIPTDPDRSFPLRTTQEHSRTHRTHSESVRTVVQPLAYFLPRFSQSSFQRSGSQ